MFNPRCDSCSKDLKRASQRFWLKMEMFADPKVEITAEELKGDAKVQYQRLLKELNNKDAKRLEEEVYVRYKLLLCKRCRDRFNARVKAREFI